jgi:hypothetical protein
MKTVWVQITNHGTGAAPSYHVYARNPPTQYGPLSYLGNTVIALTDLVVGINFTNVPDDATEILIVELGGICNNLLFLNIATTTTTSTTVEPTTTTTTTTEEPTTTPTTTIAP